jgi:hypothetical protein
VTRSRGTGSKLTAGRATLLPETVLSTCVRLHWREAGEREKPVFVWIHGASVEDPSFMLPDLEPFLPRIRALFPTRACLTRPQGRRVGE